MGVSTPCSNKDSVLALRPVVCPYSLRVLSARFLRFLFAYPTSSRSTCLILALDLPPPPGKCLVCSSAYDYGCAWCYYPRWLHRWCSWHTRLSWGLFPNATCTVYFHSCGWFTGVIFNCFNLLWELAEYSSLSDQSTRCWQCLPTDTSITHPVCKPI